MGREKNVDRVENKGAVAFHKKKRGEVGSKTVAPEVAKMATRKGVWLKTRKKIRKERKEQEEKRRK